MCWRRPSPGSSDWKKSGNWAEVGIFAAISSPSRSRQSGAIFVWCSRFGDITVNRISIAFSSEVGTGSREENASKQKAGARFRLHQNRKGSSPLSPKWAAVLLAVSVLTLSGCGRKGPLDLPPTASTVPPPGASGPAPTDTAQQQASTPSVFNPTYGSDAPPAAPKGPNRSFILDPLLGN
jgi:predicted small lipoprotein YifL